MARVIPDLPDDRTGDFTGLWARSELHARLWSNQQDAFDDLIKRFGRVRPLDFVWHDDALPPSYAFWGDELGYELLFAGTQNAKQLAVQIGGAVGVEQRGGGWVNGAWSKLWRDMAGLIYTILDQPPAWGRLVVAGHSYGGAMAAIAAYDLAARYGGDRIQVLTTGQPRYCGGAMPPPPVSKYVRVVNLLDLVPALPPVNGSLVTAPVNPLPALRSVVGGALPLWRHHGYRIGVSSTGLQADGPVDLEDVPFLIPLQAWATVELAHANETYAERIRAAGRVTEPPAFRQPGDPRPDLGPPRLKPDLYLPDPAEGMDVPATNAAYFGVGSNVITAANVAAFESSQLTVGDVIRRPPADYSVFPGVPTVGSGYTRVTLCINNGQLGHTESHVYRGDVFDSNTLTQAKALAAARAKLLGNNIAAPVAGQKALGAPCIEFIRLADAKQPRLGFVYKSRGDLLFGPYTSGGNDADPMVLGYSLRLLASGVPSGLNPGTTLGIVGQPDRLIAAGDIDNTYTVNGQGYRTLVSSYLNILTTTTSTRIGWGMMSVSGSAANQRKPVNSVTYVAPYWVVACPAHGYAEKDRVRLSGLKWPFVATFRVHLLTLTGGGVDPNNFALFNGPVSGHTPQGAGYAQRIGQADGTRTKDWYAYNGYVQDGDGFAKMTVRKVNPGREYLGVSFPHKVKKER